MLHHNWSLYLFHSELKYNSRTDSLTANMFIKSQCFRLIDFFPRKQRISLYSSMQTHIHTVYFQSSSTKTFAQVKNGTMVKLIYPASTLDKICVFPTQTSI